MEIQRKRLILILLLLLASCFGMQGRQPDFVFSHLNTANSELSFNKVHVITQDANGFIWIGTAHGLNRYDGKSIRSFSSADLGIDSAFIVSLCADEKGNLWIGSDAGLSYYNYEMDRFEPLALKSDKGTQVTNKVSRIALDKNGTVWFSVLHQGLFSYDGNRLINWFFDNGNITLPDGIRAFYIDGNGTFWLSLYFNDLYFSDDGLKTIQKAGIGKNGDWFKGDDIVGICKNPTTGTLLTASNNRGLCEVDPRSKTARVLIPNDEGYLIEAMFLDNEHRVWMATTQGALCYHLSDGTVVRLSASRDNPYGISENHLFHVFVDGSDNLWLSTYSHGVDYSGYSQSLFEKYNKTADGNSLEGCLCRNFVADPDGNLWITTEEQGLFFLRRKEKTLSHFNDKRLPNNLFGLCYDDGDLWIGSFEGMYRLNLKSKSLKLYSKSDDAAEFKDSKIYSICRTSGSDIIFGTTLGLFKYNRKTDSFHSVKEFDGVFVTDMLEDHNGQIWLASYADGIFCFNPTQDGKDIRHWSKSFSGAFHLPTDKIQSLTEDGDGRIWAASLGAGFLMLNRNTNSFQTFDQSRLSSLPSEVFYQILNDSEGVIWLSSNKGLSAYYPDSGNLQNFTVSDGLLDDSFNYNSALRCPDGKLVFGSANGFVSFLPSQILGMKNSAEIVFTDFQIRDHTVIPGEKDSPLQRHINETQSISLKPSDNSFCVRVSTPYSPRNIVYYQLEGYDSEWKMAGRDGILAWSNVPSGHYRLQVKDREGSQHKDISIVVRKVFYKTWLAIILYVLIGLLIILFVIYRMNRRTAEKAEQELFNEKMSFFANVIHEIKTPLTLIKTPLQNIISTQTVSPEAAADLAVINNSTEYLDTLVKELLDFIRVEKHGYVLEYKRVNLIELIDFLCFNFSDSAKSKNITLEFTHDESLLIGADEHALEKILNNLIHNAVKYAESYIRIHAWKESDAVVVTFSNDGPTIPPSQRQDIFKPFVQFSGKNTYSQSFGIGLSLAQNLAQLHGGTLELDSRTDETCFRLTLPIKTLAIKTEDNEDNQQISGADSSLPLLLAVEDNTDLLQYLETKLLDSYRILTATSVEKALRLIKRYDVDIILTDIALQGQSGIDLCRGVKEDIATSHIPVIILSAITSPETKILCMESGASLYIEKPFNLDYLRACLKSETDKRLVIRQNSLNNTPLVLPGTDQDFIDHLNQIIKENLTDPDFSNEQLAEDLHISKNTLIRRVKGLLGVTPKDYVRIFRLNEAAKMLCQEGCRISDVCYRVGFNTPSYFAKCFRRQFGMLPQDYMKQQLEKQ